MKASEQLKRELIAQMRTQTADRELDVSQSLVSLDFSHELPSEYEGCQAVYIAITVKVMGGQLVVIAESEEDDTTCAEADLLSLNAETIEALAEAVEAAAKGD